MKSGLSCDDTTISRERARRGHSGLSKFDFVAARDLFRNIQDGTDGRMIAIAREHVEDLCVGVAAGWARGVLQSRHRFRRAFGFS